jgi:hypothetical protein
VGLPADAVRSGMRVTAQFDVIDDAHTLLRFHPDEAA